MPSEVSSEPQSDTSVSNLLYPPIQIRSLPVNGVLFALRNAAVRR